MTRSVKPSVEVRRDETRGPQRLRTEAIAQRVGSATGGLRTDVALRKKSSIFPRLPFPLLVSAA